MFGAKSKGNVFFDLFAKSAQNAHEAAVLLTALLDDFTDVSNKVRQLKNLEHQGDDYTHQILEYLAKTFITPLDREDIQRVATRLDDITDQIDSAANRMEVYGVQQVTDDARAFGQVLIKATSLLIDALDKLSNLKNAEAVLSLCVQIHTQENEGDRLMQHAMAALFRVPNPDPLEVIKWKDIYQILEKATDRCEDVADVLQTIIVKHA